MRNIKLILAFSLIAITAGAGVIFYSQVSKPARVENLTDLVPSEALICASGRDIDKIWQKIKVTEFYSKIINSPFFKDNPNIGALKDKTKQNWFSEDEILAALGKEVVLGAFFRSLVSKDPEFDVILLSRLSQASKAKELIIRPLLRLKENKSVSSQKYKGYRITTIKQAESKEGLSYLIFKDTLIMSNSPDLIKQAVNLAKNDYKDSISQNGEFKRNREKLSDDYAGWLYLDIEKFKQLTKNLENINYPEFNPMALSSYFLEIKFLEGLAVKGWSYLDAEKTEDASFKVILDSLSDTKLDAISFVPLNTAVFSGGNLGDMKLILPYIKEQLNNPFFKKGNGEEIKDSREFFTTLNTLLGFDLENDLLQYLGKEYAFGLSEFKEADIPLAVSEGKVKPFSLSLPEFFGCIQALDKDKVNSVMQIIWQKMSDGINARMKPPLSGQDNPLSKSDAVAEQAVVLPVSLETNNYSGVDIHTLKFQPAVLLPLGIGQDIFSPAYCFFGDYLVIASNENLSKKIINTYQKKNLSLNDSVKFSEITRKLQPKFNNLFYVNMEEVVGPVMKMVSSFTPPGSGTDIETEEYKRGLAESLFIMDVLKTLKAVGWTGWYKDGFYEFYLYVPVDGL